MRLTMALAIFIYCAASVIYADETDVAAERYYAASKAATDAKISGLRAAVPALKKQLAVIKRAKIDKRLQFTKTLPNGVSVFPSVEAKQKTIAGYEADLSEAETELKKAESGELLIYAELPTPLAVGNIGRVNFLLELIQKIDENSARVSIAGETCFLDGIELAKAADGTDFQTDVVLEVTGTRTYKTVAGASRTEFVVKPFDMKRVEAIRENDKP